MAVRQMSVNGRVIAARKEKGFTQVQLATRLKLNHADIVRIEQGWVPPPALRARLAHVLGSTDAALFGAR